MDMQKIKELALVNGFSLKEQASGNMDLHSYVYEFAQAIVVETLNQAQLVYGQDGVTTFDTESLDNEISSISSEFEAEYFFDNDDADRLEMLIAKAMRLGELYERQKWQAAKAQAVPEGFVLVEESKISYFYQDSDEPENCCSHEHDFDCLGDCIDDGDIIQIDRYAEIHLSKDTFFGTWCECEPKPFSRKTKEFRLFPSHEDAEKAMIEAQEQVG